MTSKGTVLIYYGFRSGKSVAGDTGISSEAWTSYYYHDIGKSFRVAAKSKRLNSKGFDRLQSSDGAGLIIDLSPSLQNDNDSATCQEDCLESTLEQNEFIAYSAEAAAFAQFASIDAIILASNELANANCPRASQVEHHKVRFWRNKRTRNDEMTNSSKDLTERPAKRHHFRKWLNEARDEVDLGYIYENRNRACAVAAEAARMATIRNNARAAAKVGATATAQMGTVRSRSRKSIQAGALATVKAVHLKTVSSHAREWMGICALEAANSAQTRLFEQHATSVLHSRISTSDQEPFSNKNVEGEIRHGAQDTEEYVQNISQSTVVGPEDRNIHNHNYQPLQDSSSGEDLKKEITSKIAGVYEQFEAASPAFPEFESGPLIEACGAYSPIESQSEAKSEEEFWDCISPKKSTSTESFFIESFDRQPSKLDPGELAQVIEGGDLENKLSSKSSVLGWFSKTANDDTTIATKTLEENTQECTTAAETNVWKSLGRQLGLFKKEEALNSDMEVVSPFGDNQIGYAF
ncbi:hypothetical protein ZYGR_0A04800 [Zygosaccharomyces rouxii]|uniref:Uncharacterized protein n=1 Tax=Zygosaccharomyces rouxii TaxID=4956 RepID=A0A1Q2ZTP2_ZYGRO|nr:hypothetical protein ZYGR_0A04800 [Zygosaccharomyces rouxii]